MSKELSQEARAKLAKILAREIPIIEAKQKQSTKGA